MISSTLLRPWGGSRFKAWLFLVSALFLSSLLWTERGTGTPAHVIGPHVVSSDSIRLRKIREIDGAFGGLTNLDRKSTRLNSSHVAISYAVFCLKKKNKDEHTYTH